MGQIEACTEALVKAVQESSEYREFCEVREKMRRDPELREKIQTFRKQVFETQNSREPLDMYEEMQKIGRDSQEFRREPLVAEFLSRELRVCRMMQQITLTVAQAVDLDIPDVAGDLTAI